MNLELSINEEFKQYMIESFMGALECEDIHYIFKFPNNYGASVIKGRHITYGGNEDLWEMALIFFYDETNNYKLTYERDFYDDVIGYLTDDEVNELLGKIIEY